MSAVSEPLMSNQDSSDSISNRTSFGERLNQLFATKLKIEGERERRYTLSEVTASTGISTGFLSEARRGRKENPSKDVIDLLAQFFGVPSTYFFSTAPDEGPAISAAILAAFQETLTQRSMINILLRASAYDEVEREMLLELMDSVERLRNIVDEANANKRPSPAAVRARLGRRASGEGTLGKRPTMTAERGQL